MTDDFFDERKVKSNDIVNGLARRDIHDSKGTLLVKKGTRIGEAHYQRMREEGLIQDETHTKDKTSFANQGINYVNPNSLHAKLDNIITAYNKFQKKILDDPTPREKEELNHIVINLIQLCSENTFQVLGELHLTEISNYDHVKPLYIAASLIELIKRFNQHDKQQSIDSNKQNHLVKAALLYNSGLLQIQKNMTEQKAPLPPEEKQRLRKNYPTQSLNIMKKIGVTNASCIEAVKNHNIAAAKPSLEALMLRTPFIYAGIAMPQFGRRTEDNMLNPCREFAQLFAEKKLDPVLGGLFLKINGLAPIGSIMLFDSREKAVVIEGPGENNILSSKMRFLTNKTGLQLRRPGETFYLHKTKLVQKGLSDHHSFAWSKFAPFTMWER